MPPVVWLKGLPGVFLLEILRGTERLLPVRILYWLLHPYAFTRTFLDRRPPARCWPAYLGARATAPAASRNPTSLYLNRVLEYLPDRLSSPQWRERCQIIGLDRLREPRQRGRPVMLAFCHFGPISLTAFWLRSHGIPVTSLKFGKAKARERAKRRKDRYTPFPTIPSALYLDQLREVVRLFSSGGTLLVAIDFRTGRQLDVPIAEGWTFRMATGAMRLAARHGAELIPCNIIHEGPWRFRIELGQPVPREHLTGEPDLIAAGKHLIAESLPHWRHHPEQCHPDLLQLFQPVPAVPR